MSRLFMTAAPHTPLPTDAWRIHVQVDEHDWLESSARDKITFLHDLRARYVDSNGNSAYDVVEVWTADNKLLQTMELHHPKRRSGPLGTDRQYARYS